MEKIEEILNSIYLFIIWIINIINSLFKGLVEIIEFTWNLLEVMTNYLLNLPTEINSLIIVTIGIIIITLIYKFVR